MKMKKRKNGQSKKSESDRNFSKTEGQKEGPYTRGKNAEKQERILVITESTGIAERIEFAEQSKVELSNLHEAGAKMKKSGFSKLLIIGTGNYYFHVTHDLKYWQGHEKIGLAFLQTDDKKIEKDYLWEGTEHLHVPVDGPKLAGALGVELKIKPLEAAGSTKTVLVATDSKLMGGSLKRAIETLVEKNVEVCTHASLAKKKGIERYENIIVVGDERDSQTSRDVLSDYRGLGMSIKSIYMSSKEEEPREGEIHVQSIALANLLEALRHEK